jgi:hypothetical protein
VTGSLPAPASGPLGSPVQEAIGRQSDGADLGRDGRRGRRAARLRARFRFDHIPPGARHVPGGEVPFGGGVRVGPPSGGNLPRTGAMGPMPPRTTG